MLADAGQKVITASIIHDPWRSQACDIYESMIRWIRKKDGTWEYDYTVFDQWIAFECYALAVHNVLEVLQGRIPSHPLNKII